MFMQNQLSTIDASRATTPSATIAKPFQLAAAVLVGVVILYGVGFVQTSAVHNAAHDTRHSQGFPCH